MKRLLFSGYHGPRAPALLTTTETRLRFRSPSANSTPHARGRPTARASPHQHAAGTRRCSSQVHGGAPPKYRTDPARAAPSARLTTRCPMARPPIASALPCWGARRWHAPPMRGCCREAYDRARSRRAALPFIAIRLVCVGVPPASHDPGGGGFRRLHWQGTRELRPPMPRNSRPARGQRPATGFRAFRSADLHVHRLRRPHRTRRRACSRRRRRGSRSSTPDVNRKIGPDVAYSARNPIPQRPPPAAARAGISHGFWGHLGLLHLRIICCCRLHRVRTRRSRACRNAASPSRPFAGCAVCSCTSPIFRSPAKEKICRTLPPTRARRWLVESWAFRPPHQAGIGTVCDPGFRIPLARDATPMANYGRWRGPVGLVRVFLDASAGSEPAALRDALKSGRTFVSNSALLGFEIGNARPGASIAKLSGALPFRVSMRSAVAIDHLELVHNGRVVRRFELTGNRRRHDASGEIRLRGGGWVVLRAWNDGPDPALLDLYPMRRRARLHESPAAPPAPADARISSAGWIASSRRPRRAAAEQRRGASRYARILNTARDKFRARAGTGKRTAMTWIIRSFSALYRRAFSARRCSRDSPFGIDDYLRVADVAERVFTGR